MVASLPGRRAILVMNKSDLVPATAIPPIAQGRPQIGTSALTGAGLDDLKRAILHEIGADGPAHEAGFLTSARHHGLITESLRALDAAEKAVRQRTPHEMLLLDLYGALRALDHLTGQTSADDILHLIFGTFCIGK
jgi:tRNA modification GTPase